MTAEDLRVGAQGLSRFLEYVANERPADQRRLGYRSGAYSGLTFSERNAAMSASLT